MKHVDNVDRVEFMCIAVDMGDLEKFEELLPDTTKEELQQLEDRLTITYDRVAALYDSEEADYGDIGHALRLTQDALKAR